jgi:hypothetical protein
MAGQPNQSKKSNNRKLVILFVGLIIIGIVCVKLQKAENLKKEEEKNPLEKAYNELKSKLPIIAELKY